MSLKNLIAGSYGSADNKFAGHPSDSKVAAESIVEANLNDIGLEEFLDLHVEHLKSKGLDQGRIDEELAKVRNISNYFKHD